MGHNTIKARLSELEGTLKRQYLDHATPDTEGEVRDRIAKLGRRAEMGDRRMYSDYFCVWIEVME